MKDRMINYNREMFAVFIEFLITVVVLVCCGWLIYNNTQEVTPEQLDIIRMKFTPGLRHLLLPELRERTTFTILTLLSVPLCITAVYINRKLDKFRNNLDNPYGIIILNIFVLLLVFACMYEPYVHLAFMYVLFKILLECPLLFLPVGVLTAFMIYAVFKWNLNKWHYGMSILLLFILLLQILVWRLYGSLDQIDNAALYHPNIIAYAISQAVAGHTDYHQYGFYDRILAPLFMINSPNLLNISIVMGGLFVTGCLCTYWVIYKNIKNKLLVFAFALIFFLTNGIWRFLYIDKSESWIDPYFAYYPIRFIFPALAVLFFYSHIRFREKYLIFICGALAGISLWWNFDSGVAVAGAFFALMFLELIFSRSRASLVQFLSFLISAGLASFVLLLIFSIQQGEIISPVKTLKHLKIFSSFGFMMMPMPGLLAPWCFFIGVYLLGIIIGLRSFISGKFSILAKMSLFLAVLGIGLFTYYQGRSHIANLLSVAWPSLMLLVIYSDRIIRFIKYGMGSRYFKLLLLPLFFMLSCAIVTIAAGSEKLVLGVERTLQCMTNVDKPCLHEQNISFILANTNDHKVVNIISDMQGVYYAKTGLRAGIDNFNMVEIILIDDLKRIMYGLYTAKVPLFVSRRRLSPWMYKVYTLKAVSWNGSLFYFVPKNRGQKHGAKN